MKLLLSAGASIDATDVNDRTPLHNAATRGNTGTVELLLSKGASTEAMGRCEKATPLHCAAREGHTGTVELLLSKGASIEAMDIYNKTPLHCAASIGHIDTVELLLSRGASIEARNEYNETPLALATRYHCPDTMQLLQDKAAELASRGKHISCRPCPESHFLGSVAVIYVPVFPHMSCWVATQDMDSSSNFGERTSY